MVKIELELLGDVSQEEIYAFRNFLNDAIPEAGLSIKPQPPAPGQMGEILMAVLAGSLHAGASIAVEMVYHNFLHPYIKAWNEKRKAEKKPALQVMSSLSTTERKLHVLEKEDGATELFDFPYAIDMEKTRVFLAGVSRFSTGFHDIPPVEGNLIALYRLLTDKRHMGIPRENIVVSGNETHTEIQKKLLLLSRLPDTETLIIYFAGHGHRADAKKLTLVAADTEKIGDDVIGGIDLDFLQQKILKPSTAHQKILILDTCHSGIAAQGPDDLARTLDVRGSYILTSSPGDELSYFSEGASQTYFTGSLLKVLETGLDNAKEMLTLDDLYQESRDLLLQQNLPEPGSKSDLNIPPANFFIARNPGFSPERLKGNAARLFAEGKTEAALDEYRLLLKKYPDDPEIRKQFERCETELSFARIFDEANASFYQKKDYATAAVLYRKAYRLKEDPLVMERITQSEALLGRTEEKPIEIVPRPDPVPSPFILFFKRNAKKIAAGALILALGWLGWHWYEERSGDMQEYVRMLQTEPAKAVAQLEDLARNGNDSARYILGRHYWGQQQYMKAADLFEKAALPAAKSALGILYWNRLVGNSIGGAADSKVYFESALRLGRDSTANKYLGFNAHQKLFAGSRWPDWNSFADKTNWEDAVRNYEECARQHCKFCVDSLGTILFKRGNQLFGQGHDHFDEAYGYLVKSSQYGNADAMVDLGHMFEDSAWSRQQLDSSTHWYKMAADLDNPHGLNQYAVKLIDGATRSNDHSGYDAAYDLLTRAIRVDSNLSKPYYNIGFIYQYGGLRIRQRNDMAILYYQKALAKGDADAKNALQQLGVQVGY
jgi:TPR repeat protein